MSLDQLFQFASSFVLIGWLALLASPFIPVWSDRIAAIVVPALLAVAYVGIILAFWGTASGGFDSLDGVAQLFQARPLLLAGWVHYLAFDLFVGAAIARMGRAAALPFWLVLPCLPLTFIFGPAGFLAFLAIRAALRPSAVVATA